MRYVALPFALLALIFWPADAPASTDPITDNVPPPKLYGELLKHKDPEVRRNAAFSAGKEQVPMMVDSLIPVLKDENTLVRREAAWALGMVLDRTVMETGTAAFSASVPVKEAKKVTVEEQRSRAADALIAALNDQDAVVRSRAATALGMIKDNKAAGPLIAALKDTVSSVRKDAAWALGSIRDSKAVDPLIAALKDEDWFVRESAAYALGRIKDTKAVEALRVALKDPMLDVRRGAAEAIKWITGKEPGVDPANWME